MRELNHSLIHYNLKDVFSYLGAVSASLVLVIMIAIACYKPHLIARVSLRLQTGIAAADLVLAIASIRHMLSGKGFWCANNGFFRTASQLMYCALNICIAFNLQLVFIHKIPAKKWWEKVYWLVSVVFTISLMIPMLAMDYFGFDGRGCFLRIEISRHDGLRQFISLYLLMITMAYCTIVAVMVMLKLGSQIKTIDNIVHTDKTDDMSRRSDLQLFIRKLILRVSLYPICCFICYSGQAAFSLAYVLDYQSEFLIEWTMFGFSLSGVVNLIAFLLDPTFHLALIEINKDYLLWRHKNNPTNNTDVELYEATDGHKSFKTTVNDSNPELTTNERLISETYYL